jgi:hypothetical protein
MFGWFAKAARMSLSFRVQNQPNLAAGLITGFAHFRKHGAVTA